MTTSNVKYGDIYLMYNSGTGKNCAVVIRTSYVGTSTMLDAGLLVQAAAPGWSRSATISTTPRRRRLPATSAWQYDGWIQGTTGDWANGGRYTWGNCG